MIYLSMGGGGSGVNGLIKGNFHWDTKFKLSFLLHALVRQHSALQCSLLELHKCTVLASLEVQTYSQICIDPFGKTVHAG